MGFTCCHPAHPYNKAAGYSSQPKTVSNIGVSKFTGPAPPLLKKSDDGPEELCREMERKVRRRRCTSNTSARPRV